MPNTASRIACTSRTSSKAKELDGNQLDQIRCPYTQMSLRLQDAFGLRREASIKIVPALADQGRHAACSRPPGTRAAAKSAFLFVPRNSGSFLTKPRRSPRARASSRRGTPPTTPISSTSAIECERVGIHGVHGHRHRYAQRRYQELTGWECPARGGPTSKQLTKEQKQRDREARAAHQPRDGPRPRADDGGLLRSIGYCIRPSREPRAARRIPG